MFAKKQDNNIYLYDSFLHKDTIKEILGRQWHPDIKAWSVPYTRDNVMTLQMLGCELDEELFVVLNDHHSSTNIHKQIDIPIEPMPIKANPYKHQVEGYNLACLTMNLFIGGDRC
jgi:hypothetical protein